MNLQKEALVNVISDVKQCLGLLPGCPNLVLLRPSGSRTWCTLECSGWVDAPRVLRVYGSIPALSSREQWALKLSVGVLESHVATRVGAIKGVMVGHVMNSKDWGTCLLMPVVTCLAKWKGKLTDIQRLQIGREMVRILRRVHERGIYHCDVKPHNMFVGESVTKPLLGDFGSAYLWKHHDAHKNIAFNGTSIFTVSRSAPPSRERDFQSLCLSLLWLAKPWSTRAQMPSWRTVLKDTVAAHIWAIYEGKAHK